MKKTLLQFFHHYLWLTFIISIVMLAGCGGENDYAESTIVEEDSSMVSHGADAAKRMFFMLPSPIETSSLLQKAGASYESSILNPIENISKYDLAKKKAINLGVYGADLSYACVFDQSQEAVFFLTNCKKLADGLGIDKAFDAVMMERIEANLDNKDSILYIISDSYWLADAYLQDNERANLSALIISGGWVEGLYIATQLVSSPRNELIVQRIAEQKNSLEQLLEILNFYEDDDEIKSISFELKDLYTTFEKITEVKINKKENQTSLVGESKELILTPEVLNEIKNKVTTIRNQFINN
jgi:hypothetical protein